MEALRVGEISPAKLIDRLGIEQANASQHLSILRAKMIVVSRKEGNHVLYSLRDPRPVRDSGYPAALFHSQWTDTKNILEEIGAKREADK